MEDEEPQRSVPHPQNNPRIQVTRAESIENSQSDTEEGSEEARIRLNGQTSERRGSVPTGLVEHHLNPQAHSLCGQILRVMGDEMCYSYYLRNRYYSSQQNGSTGLTSSHSLPDLRRQ